MIEVPSAVMTADKIAKVVDFFELGTNDLVQYVLAVDRSNDKVADWFRTLHPAVLEASPRSLQAARAADIPTYCLRRMASTPAYAVCLAWQRHRPKYDPAGNLARAGVLSGIDSRDATEIAAQCLTCQTADEVEKLCDSFLQRWPHLFLPNTCHREPK